MIAEIPLWSGQKQEPKRIIVHALAEFLDMDPTDLSAHQFLQRNKLSAHALITPSGVAIRCIPDDRIGAHAKHNNLNTLGIEFLVSGVHTYPTFIEAIKTPYLTVKQYEAGLELVDTWVNKYSISTYNVVRHSDISPGRKVDPGEGFPWEDFLQKLERRT